MFDLLGYIRDAVNFRLFKLGGADFTVGSLITTLAALFLLLIFARWQRRWMYQRVLARGNLDLNTRETVSTLTQYVVVAFGLVVILNSIGVNLSSFTVLAGALGVGVGFGLQNIFSNFISGLIVMFERPVKIGDHVVVSGVEGDVVAIGMRATTLRSAQGSLIIVPNQSFITGNVVNWDQAGSSAMVLQYRMMGTPSEEEALLLGALGASPEVLKTPAPSVYLAAIDYAGHVMEVHFWLAGDAVQRLKVVGDINKKVLAELALRTQTLAHNP
jgi:small-conductance mechanosensitive channel